jgi:AcrR family transcriptional regulator
LWVLAAPRTKSSAARRPPRPAASLSRTSIVATAIRVADAEGADAVTMRRLARELGASPMALYWHVADKGDLLRLMVDEVEGEIEIPPPSGDWRADVTATARRYRKVLLRHGWMTSFIGMRQSLGPKELPHIERSLAAFDGLGLPVRDAFNIIMAIETYYLGFALREQQELAAERAAKRVAPARRRAFIKAESRRLEDTGEYPRLAELFSHGTFTSRDERFELGLTRLLDGIEASLPKS